VAIAYTLTVEKGPMFRCLNFRPLVWIGTISYSVYIWQQIFLLYPSGKILPLGRLSLFPLNIAGVFAVASCSFYFLERPAIAFGKRILRQKREPSSPLLDDGALMATVKVSHDMAPWQVSACLSIHSVLELASGTVRWTQMKPEEWLESSSVSLPSDCRSSSDASSPTLPQPGNNEVWR
jgi:peptidoglycan/LPS O-acetylase OafA/YrhL